jgi:hypothetical protein
MLIWAMTFVFISHASDSEGKILNFDDFKSEVKSSVEYDRCIEILQSLVESKNYSKQEDIELQTYRQQLGHPD